MVLQSVILAAKTKHTATVIFLHGLGDTGHGWLPVMTDLQKTNPHIKFILPNAPIQKVTLNMGMQMPSWYDIYSLDKSDKKQDQPGLFRAVSEINTLISEEEKISGISSKRIVVGGFSQGSAVGLLYSLVTANTLAGFMCLSGYVPLKEEMGRFLRDDNERTPYFIGHGNADEVVQFQWGKESVDFLRGVRSDVTFKTYNGLGHACSDEEERDMNDFLKKVLP